MKDEPKRRKRKLFWQHVQKPGDCHPSFYGLENEIIGDGWEEPSVKVKRKYNISTAVINRNNGGLTSHRRKLEKAGIEA